ncbi:MAG: carbohydrate kinase family protein [Gemmatimonadota bacterium]
MEQTREDGAGGQVDVAVAGNAVVDIFVRGGAETGARARAVDAWGPATQLLGRPIELLLGGCGAAAAYVLGRLGARVILNSNIGDDALGGLLRTWLADAGVVLLAGGSPRASAAHVVHLDDGGRRRSSYYTGDRVPWERSAAGPAAPWLLAAGHGGVAARDTDELAALFASLRARGTKVAFDPSPWFAGRADAEQMGRLWRQVDVLVGTGEELGHWHRGDSPLALARGLCAAGPQVVVLKQGPEGATYATRSGDAGHQPAAPVPGANSVGAGDTFNARLVAGLSRGEGLAAAVGHVVSLATQVVRRGRGALGAFEES